MSQIFNCIIWIYRHTKKSLHYVILLIAIGCLVSLLSVSQALISKNLIDCATLGEQNLIIKWIIFLALLLLAQILANGGQSILSTYCTANIQNKIQKHLYTHIIHSEWLSFNNYHSIDLLTRCSSDVVTITTTIVNTIPQILSLIVMFITSFIALITISPIMAVAAFFIFPLIIFFGKYFGKKQKQFYISLQKIQSKYNSFLQESFNNLLIVKSFCLENEKKSTLSSLQRYRLNLSIKRSYIGCVSNSLFAFSSLIGYFLVFSWGAFSLSAGTIMFGSLTAMLQLFSNIQSPIFGLSSALPQLVSTMGAIERLQDIEALPIEQLSPYTVIDKDVIINFTKVNFSYTSDLRILNDITFNINPGEIIALVGSSGGGKTTIVRLLLSLIYPNSGSIKINNQDLTVAHRNLMSYVPQGNTLFSGSILENLRFGNQNATIDEINTVLKMASAYDFINKFTDGINTVIGEKGIGISEGQSQRLTIARALLRKKPILILDEATSSLDGETEVNILKEIRNLDYNPICIIITHRPSALLICNKVYKLENTLLNTVN